VLREQGLAEVCPPGLSGLPSQEDLRPAQEDDSSGHQGWAEELSPPRLVEYWPSTRAAAGSQPAAKAVPSTCKYSPLLASTRRLIVATARRRTPRPIPHGRVQQAARGKRSPLPREAIRAPRLERRQGQPHGRSRTAKYDRPPGAKGHPCLGRQAGRPD
jgi:hypothetical protein